MKQILVAILVLTSIFSCKKDKNEPKDTLSKETISAKWTVDGISVFESFEFNKSGNYIIVKNTTAKSTINQIVLFGTYVIKDNTIVLSDFGIIKISEIGDNSINFSILLDSNPNNEISIIATKQKEMQNSTKMDLLCRTWELVTIDEEDVTGTDMELTVLFSAAGTYFVSFANPEDESEGGIAQWKWKDETETKFLYSWDQTPVWDEEAYVEILELTSNKLKIMEDGVTYLLQPVSNAKSAVINTSKSSSNRTMKSGFFKK